MNTATTNTSVSKHQVPGVVSLCNNSERRAQILAETVSPEEFFTSLKEEVNRRYEENTKAK